MEGERPRSLVMVHAGSAAAALDAAARVSAQPPWLYHRVRAEGDTTGPEYLALAGSDARAAVPGQGTASAEPRLIALTRCRPPAGRGWTAFTSAKSGNAPITGIVVVRSVFPEQRRRYAFNRWYNQHIPYVFTKGVFHTAYRYLAAEPEPDGRLLHWAFYETDLEDFARAMPANVAAARNRERGRFPPYVQVLQAWMFERTEA